jgi:4-hydroxybenzoate polyprenyltransferase
MDHGQWKLLLRRPHRRQLWRLVLGALLFSALLDGGSRSTPEWISDVVDVFLFFLALWLVFTAGFAFHRSVADSAAEMHEDIWAG